MEVAGVGGSIPEEAQHHLVSAAHLDGKRCARGDRDIATHYPGRSEVPLGDVGNVHRPAPAPAVARRAAAQLRHHPVEVLLLSFWRFGVLVAVGVAMSMAAVSACDVVVLADSRNGPNGHGLFASVKVRGPFDDVAAEQIVHGVLEIADLPHLPEHREQLVFARQANSCCFPHSHFRHRK